MTMKIKWEHPWWLPKGKRGICLPPFGIWIDPRLMSTGLGEAVADHELCHWEQWERNKWTYYPKHIWYGLTRTKKENPLEIECHEASGVW